MSNQFYIKVREGSKGVVKSVEVSFPILSSEKNGKFIAESPIFKAIGYSDTSKELAHDDLVEDIKIFLLFHIKNRSLKNTLKLLGWKEYGYSSKRFESPVIPIDKYKTAKSEMFDLKVA